jgi:hypothetical protein
MKAELRALHCATIDDLENFRPNGDFGIFVQALIGPKGAIGAESFEIAVCTPGWFATQMTTGIAPGIHVLFMTRFDYDLLNRFVSSYCENCTGNSWAEVAQKLTRLGKWEFEDYRP